MFQSNKNNRGRKTTGNKKNSRSKAARRTMLNWDGALEARTLLAAPPSITLSNGELVVKGDDFDNLITLETTSSGQVDVVVTTSDLNVLPNNMVKASFPVGNINRVHVSGFDGNDHIDLSKLLVMPEFYKAPISTDSVIVTGGDGNDFIAGVPFHRKWHHWGLKLSDSFRCFQG